MQRGNYARAIRLLSMAVKNRANAYKIRSGAYFLSGDPDKALADINRYLSMQRQDPAAYLLRGDVALSLGKTLAALADYRAAMRLDPSSAEALVSRGLAYLSLERYASAVRDFRAALDINPRNVDALSNLGVANMLAQRPQAARTFLTEAMRLETNPKCRQRLSELLARLPNDTASGPDRDLPVEDDVPEDVSAGSGSHTMRTQKEEPYHSKLPSRPAQPVTRKGNPSNHVPAPKRRMRGTHLSGQWETSYHGVRITLDVNHSGSSLSGVMQIHGPFGRDSTYHFTGSAGFDGTIRAVHHSGHAFDGRLTDDGRIVGTVTTRFGTKFPVDFAPH